MSRQDHAASHSYLTPQALGLLDPDSLQYMMRWQPPVPASGWPVYDSGPEERAAERAEQERNRQRAERLKEQGSSAFLRAWIAEAGRQLGLKNG